jgi:hypothetical protein
MKEMVARQERSKERVRERNNGKIGGKKRNGSVGEEKKEGKDATLSLLAGFEDAFNRSIFYIFFCNDWVIWYNGCAH